MAVARHERDRPAARRRHRPLSEAIHHDARLLEGFRAVSAKVPSNRNLVVFPDHLRAGSYVEYEWDDAAGMHHTYRVDQARPDGVEV